MIDVAVVVVVGVVDVVIRIIFDVVADLDDNFRRRLRNIDVVVVDVIIVPVCRLFKFAKFIFKIANS